MKPVDSKTVDPTLAQKDAQSVLERSGRELVLFHLRCAQTANGLSHYYMHGDVPADETLL